MGDTNDGGIHERSPTTGCCESSYAELIQTAVQYVSFRETVRHETVFISRIQILIDGRFSFEICAKEGKEMVIAKITIANN